MARRPSPHNSGSSSPASFYTANDSDDGGEEEEEEHDSTTASSPAQAAPCPYREARRLPRELKGHCQIFLEEQLCTRRRLPPPRAIVARVLSNMIERR